MPFFEKVIVTTLVFEAMASRWSPRCGVCQEGAAGDDDRYLEKRKES
jgi:hypothetical protein